MDEKLVDDAPAPEPESQDAEAGEIVIPDYAVDAPSASSSGAAPAAGGSAPGGGAGLDGILSKLRVINVPAADGSGIAQEAAKLQSDLMNITFWSVLFSFLARERCAPLMRGWMYDSSLTITL